MKTITLLTSLLTLSVLAPVVAMGAVNCEAKKSSMTTAQRAAYNKHCIAKSSSPAKVHRVASVSAPAVAEPKNTSMTTAQSIADAKQRLAEASAPAKVQQIALQQKKMSCEQNAKNKALQGAEKSQYITKCVNQNNAREAAEAMAGSQKANSASLQRKYSSNATAARID